LHQPRIIPILAFTGLLEFVDCRLHRQYEIARISTIIRNQIPKTLSNFCNLCASFMPMASSIRFLKSRNFVRVKPTVRGSRVEWDLARCEGRRCCTS